MDKCPRCNSAILFRYDENRCPTCGWSDYEESIELIITIEDFHKFLYSKNVQLVGKNFAIQNKQMDLLRIKKVFESISEPKTKSWHWTRRTDIPNVAWLCDHCDKTKDKLEYSWTHLPRLYIQNIKLRNMYFSACERKHGIKIFNMNVRNGKRLSWKTMK